MELFISNFLYIFRWVSFKKNKHLSNDLRSDLKSTFHVIWIFLQKFSAIMEPPIWFSFSRIILRKKASFMNFYFSCRYFFRRLRTVCRITIATIQTIFTNFICSIVQRQFWKLRGVYIFPIRNNSRSSKSPMLTESISLCLLYYGIFGF